MFLSVPNIAKCAQDPEHPENMAKSLSQCGGGGRGEYR